MDLSFDDGAYRGIKDAFPKANIAPKGSKGIYHSDFFSKLESIIVKS